MTNVCLKPITEAQEKELVQLKNLYLSSFPEDERREWSSLLSLSRKHALSLLGIYASQKLMGMMTVWTFDRFVYIEHFAVESSARGQGIGASALKAVEEWLDSRDKNRPYTQTSALLPIVVEVELAETGHDAMRRIGFYQRCGFVPLTDYEYIQPPYAPHLQPVRLMLMSTSEIDPEHVAKTLHRRVYGA